MKLPVVYLPFESGIVYTYCHCAIDTLFTRQSPVKSVVKFGWAKQASESSKKRRLYGHKPDAIICRFGWELAFIEVKPGLIWKICGN